MHYAEFTDDEVGLAIFRDRDEWYVILICHSL